MDFGVVIFSILLIAGVEFFFFRISEPVQYQELKNSIKFFFVKLASKRCKK